MAEQDRTRRASDVFIGVVTVLFNSDDVLEDFVASLASAASHASFEVKLYCIDNSPTATGTDTVKGLCQRSGLAGEFVFNNANVGVAAGNNQGLRLALADGCTHVLFANNDIEFAPDTLRVLVDALMASGEKVATPKILYHGQEIIWYGGGSFDWKARTHHAGFEEADVGQCDRQALTGYAPTCFMLLEASVFERVGEMDERYFCYYDDSDFVWRMAQSGIPVLYVPGSVVRHKVSFSTGGNLSSFSIYYMNRNRIYFARKNYRGLHRFVALATILLSLARKSIRRGPLTRQLLARMWSGAWDGLRLPATKASA
ncbi:MAG: glycosyltransferase family 2 protein [Geminicoccaceae bacterium]